MRWKYAGLTIIAIVVWALYFSCSTTNPGVGHDVQLSAEQIGELRQQNRELTERISKFETATATLRESIGRAEVNAAQASDDIRGAIELLKQYKSAIDRLLHTVTSTTAPIAVDG
jgi:ABC-type transporter Mla subunit MlaD